MDKKKKSASSNAVPLDPSLAKLVLEPESDKIRRPPNAFMIFGREHRKTVSKLHPNVNNKEISTILGKLWKNSTEETKKKYYDKAKLLGDLHKRRFPDYVYSPREARIQKKRRFSFRTRKGDIELKSTTVRNTESIPEILKKTKWEDNFIDEDKTNDSSPDSQPSLGYVPNNPGFYQEISPESPCEESQNMRPCYHSPANLEFCKEDAGETPIDMNSRRKHYDMDCRSRISETAGCCSRNTLESNTQDMPQQRMPDRISPHFSDCREHHPCSYTLPPPFCHNSGPFPGSVCCSSSPDPRVYRPPYHPFWYSPMIPHHLQSSSNLMCDDGKSFSYTPSTEFYGPPPTHFERSFAPNCRSSSFGFYPRCKEDLECSQTEYSELRSHFSRSNESYHNSSYAYPTPSKIENEDYAQNGRPSMANTPNREYLPCFKVPEAKQVNQPALNSNSSNNEIRLSSRRSHEFECYRQSYTCTQISGDKSKDSSGLHQFTGIQDLCDSSTNSNKNAVCLSQTESISDSIIPAGVENSININESNTFEPILNKNFQNLHHSNSCEVSDLELNKFSNILHFESIRPDIQEAIKTNEPFNIQFTGIKRTPLQATNSVSNNIKSAEQIENLSTFTDEKCISDSFNQNEFFSEASVQSSRKASSHIANKDCNEPPELLSGENKSQDALTSSQSNPIPTVNQECRTNVSSVQMSMPEIKIERMSPDSSFNCDGNFAVERSTAESSESDDFQGTTEQVKKPTETHYIELKCERDSKIVSDTYSNSLE